MSNTGLNRRQTLTVLYDGACPMCQREIAFYKRLIPISSSTSICYADVNDPSLTIPDSTTLEILKSRFHVRFENQELISGAKAFIALWTLLPGWRWLAITARIPGIIWCLEMNYRLFLIFRPTIQNIFKHILKLTSRKTKVGYVSEITEFINELKCKDPELESKQLYGRNILWNRPQDLDTNKDLNSGREAQPSYVYYSLPDIKKPLYDVDVDKR